MKRGEGSAVANFILMFALFIVVYLILLPQGAKEQLILPGPEGAPVEGQLLLSESPGLVKPFLRETTSRRLQPIKLFALTETEPKILVRSLSVSTSLFSTKSEDLKFDLQELDDLTDLSVIFLVQDASGRLILTINGQEFFNDFVRIEDLPIEIPLKALKKENNILTITASSPGLRFLSANRYYLKDIQLVKKLAVENKIESRNFIVTPSENKDLVSSFLSFFINCLRVKELGTLKISLNSKEISNRFMVCDAGQVELEINPEDIYEGENLLEFEVDKGEYILEQIILDNELESEDYPKYFFSLQRGEFFAVEDGAAVVELELDFDDAGYRKAATLLINGERVYLDTLGRTSIIDLSDYVVEGENFIKIVPREEFDIVNLQVLLR